MDPGSIDKAVRVFFTIATLIVPLAAPDAARTTAVPGAIPVRIPAASTVATEGVPEAQEIGASRRGSPLKICAAALSFTVPPTTMGFVIGSITTIFGGEGL